MNINSQTFNITRDNLWETIEQPIWDPVDASTFLYSIEEKLENYDFTK